MENRNPSPTGQSLRAGAPSWQPRATAPALRPLAPPQPCISDEFGMPQLRAFAPSWQPPQPAFPPPYFGGPPLGTPYYGGAMMSGPPPPYLGEQEGQDDEYDDDGHYDGEEEAEEEELPPPRVWPLARGPCGNFLIGTCPHSAGECVLVHDPLAAAQLAAAATATLDGVVVVFRGGAGTRGGGGFVVADVSTAESRERAARVAVSGLTAAITDGEVREVLSLYGSAAVRIASRPADSHATVQFATREDAAAAIADLNGSELERWRRDGPAEKIPKSPGTDKSPVAEKEAAWTVALAHAPPAGALATPGAGIEVAWTVPSRTVIANLYGSKRSVAERVSAGCDGKLVRGSPVRVSFEPSSAIKGSYVLTLSGVDGSATKEELLAWLREHGGSAPDALMLPPMPFEQ
ncbi:hypothetical protein T492DRAFT_909894, partial [Pavlovales sp. CCMP2436]